MKKLKQYVVYGAMDICDIIMAKSKRKAIEKFNNILKKETKAYLIRE